MVPLTYFHRSLYVHKLHATTSQMQATSLPQHFCYHDKVRKTDLKPLQLVKGEWSPPLQQLPVPSVNTKFLRIDSTKYSCVQFDVQFSTCSKQTMNVFLRYTLAWVCVDFSCKTAFISYHVSCNECKNSFFEVMLFVVWLNWVLTKFGAIKSWVMIGLWWL